MAKPRAKQWRWPQNDGVVILFCEGAPVKMIDDSPCEYCMDHLRKRCMSFISSMQKKDFKKWSLDFSLVLGFPVSQHHSKRCSFSSVNTNPCKFGTSHCHLQWNIFGHRVEWLDSLLDLPHFSWLAKTLAQKTTAKTGPPFLNCQAKRWVDLSTEQQQGLSEKLTEGGRPSRWIWWFIPG